MYEAMPDHTQKEGCFKAGGHAFNRHTLRCQNVLTSTTGNMCNRHIDDVLADIAEAKLQDAGIACIGQLTSTELESLKAAAECRRRAIERGMAA